MSGRRSFQGPGAVSKGTRAGMKTPTAGGHLKRRVALEQEAAAQAQKGNQREQPLGDLSAGGRAGGAARAASPAGVASVHTCFQGLKAAASRRLRGGRRRHTAASGESRYTNCEAPRLDAPAMRPANYCWACREQPRQGQSSRGPPLPAQEPAAACRDSRSGGATAAVAQTLQQNAALAGEPRETRWAVVCGSAAASGLPVLPGAASTVLQDHATPSEPGPRAPSARPAPPLSALRRSPARGARHCSAEAAASAARLGAMLRPAASSSGERGVK